MEKQSLFFTLSTAEMHHVSNGIITTSEIL